METMRSVNAITAALHHIVMRSRYDEEFCRLRNRWQLLEVRSLLYAG